MSEKTLYDFENQDLSDYEFIERETFRKAVELNDLLLDAKTILEEVTYEWNDFIDYLEDKNISKYCEFKCREMIPFDDELKRAIVLTLKQSLTNTQKAIDYNSKKIKINRVIDG